MTPLQRKAAFRAAVTLRQITMAEAATELGVSYNHLTLVINGERVGSARLEEAIAAVIGRPVAEVFGRTPRNTARKR
ncbi:MAG TPA: helix-turn-helix transcriptional regulator [Gemmatimonadaceae bacterium]